MKAVNVSPNHLSMRIPTDQEYDLLMDATHEDDSLSHWKKIFSWVNDKDNKYKFSAAWDRVVRGCFLPRCWCGSSDTNQNAIVGFRPAFTMAADALLSGIQNKGPFILGTLYMGGTPVRVPKAPTHDGDIADYIPGTKLELKDAISDPAYQVTAIKVADGVFVADRVLLKCISYLDIKEAISGSAVLTRAGKGITLWAN